ncbi:MAG: hypothetical protein FWE11_07635 [Defluviitaleaceae bacterium]|nr:hypothetical protein [Defluviitaleaceae bacterium]
MTKNIKRTRIQVSNGKAGLDVYLDISGAMHYLYTYKSSGLIYQWLKDGKTIGELSRMKPGPDTVSQKRYNYAKRLLIIADEYYKHEIAA